MGFLSYPTLLCPPPPPPPPIPPLRHFLRFVLHTPNGITTRSMGNLFQRKQAVPVKPSPEPQPKRRPSECNIVWCVSTRGFALSFWEGSSGFLSLVENARAGAQWAAFTDRESAVAAAPTFVEVWVVFMKVVYIDKDSKAITVPTFLSHPEDFQSRVPPHFGFGDFTAHVAWGAKPLTGPWSKPDSTQRARELHDKIKQDNHLKHRLPIL